MSEPSRLSGRTRLTLDLSSRLNDAVERYADEHGLAKADVLRNAVDFLLRAEKAQEEGMTVIAVKDNPQTKIRTEREILVSHYG